MSHNANGLSPVLLFKLQSLRLHRNSSTFVRPMTTCCLKLKEKKKKTDQYLLESGTYSTNKLASGNFQCGNIILPSSEDTSTYVVLHMFARHHEQGSENF